MIRFAWYFQYFSELSILIPIYFFLKERSRLNNNFKIIIGLFLILSAVTELIASLMAHVWRQPNNVLTNCFIVIEFFLLSSLFVRLCPGLKKISYGVGAGFAIIFMLTSIFWQDIHRFQSITRVAESVVFIAYAIMFYFSMLKELPVNNIMQYGPFWIVTGIETYFCLNVYLFALSTYFFYQAPAEVSIGFWAFHSINETAKNILIALGLYFAGKPKTN